VIAVTCRNGEHFSLDPGTIERVESDGDVSVILEDGTRYVVGESFDELLRRVRDHRAAAVSARRMLSGPTIAPHHVPPRPPAEPATAGSPVPGAVAAPVEG
jgi:uncharacterized protein YlzI (FlbEa/FlbD family)